MEAVVLFRSDYETEAEAAEARRHFTVVARRSEIPSKSLVIGRYSVLPFYRELADDVGNLGSTMLTSFNQHRYVADLRNWYADLEGLTPQTWFRLEDIPEDGPFVVKGETNSRKHQWNTHMFAANKRVAVQVANRLMDDSLIGTQSIYARRYVPLVRLGTGLNGLPITKEFRFFVCHAKVISGDFYWSSHVDDLGEVPKVSEVPSEFLTRVMARVGAACPFYVVDVAQTESGDWIVVELNDAQMSGLSENDPAVLYPALKKRIEEVY